MYMDTIFASPICFNDTFINHDQVIQKLDMDIISYDATLGYQAAFREYIVVMIKVEAKKYAAGINWLRHLMWNIQFTHDRYKYNTNGAKEDSLLILLYRLIVAVNKTLNDIPQAKRNGKLVADWTMRAMHTNITKSTEATCSYLYQDTFLPGVLEKLRTDPDQVIQDMNEYQSICKFLSCFKTICGSYIYYPF